MAVRRVMTKARRKLRQGTAAASSYHRIHTPERKKYLMSSLTFAHVRADICEFTSKHTAKPDEWMAKIFIVIVEDPFSVG